MIVGRPNTFFVNGHKCEIENKRRAHYVGYIDGEEMASGSNSKRLRDALIGDAKYRPEVEPDFKEVTRVVYNFLKSQTDRDGNYVWVYNDTVMDNVTPLDAVGDAYMALLELEGHNIIEEEQVCVGRNVGSMWRALDIPNLKEQTEDMENPWNQWE